MQPLATTRRGTGPPVLFLHGLGGSSRYWTTIADHQPPFEMVMPDLLGFGRSPRSEGDYSVDRHVAALLPVLDRPMVLVGHSVGASLASAIASFAPSRSVALVLIGAPVFPDAATARAELSQLGIMAAATVHGGRLARGACWALCHARAVARVLAPLADRTVPSWVARDAVDHTWSSYSGTLRALALDYRLAAALRSTTCPVHFLHGNRDRVTPSDRVAKLATDLRAVGKRCAITVAPGDHHLPLRDPDLCIREILAATVRD